MSDKKFTGLDALRNKNLNALIERESVDEWGCSLLEADLSDIYLVGVAVESGDAFLYPAETEEEAYSLLAEAVTDGDVAKSAVCVYDIFNNVVMNVRSECVVSAFGNWTKV